MNVLLGQRENRIVKDSYKTIVRCTDCPKERQQKKRGKDLSPGVQERAEGRQVPRELLGLRTPILRATRHEQSLVPR